MTTAILNAASPVKRVRATREEMEARYDALVAIVNEIQPATVRQVFYQASVRAIVEKTEASYNKVQRALADLRRAGRVPWSYIADNTRWEMKPTSYVHPEQAMLALARVYRKALWANADCNVEVWLEKDALSTFVYEVTGHFDVPLMVSRGYASITFLQQAASDILDDGRPTFVYHLGDYDPSGVNAAEKIEESLREFAPGAEIHFTRLAVLPEQIRDWSLPTRPTKTTDSRSKRFGDISVELDSIHPNVLREIVSSAISRHMPADRLRALKAEEEAERRLLSSWARSRS